MNKKNIRKKLLRVLEFFSFPIILFFLIINSVAARCLSRGYNVNNCRIVCGSVPIINNSHWAMALRRSGYNAETYTQEYYNINDRSEWDKILNEEYSLIPSFAKPLIAFGVSVHRYDIFIISFNGFFIGHTLFNKYQSFLLKIADKKIVVIPFGQDVYVYRNILSTSVVHGLMSSYPIPSRLQFEISSNVDYWTKNADVLIPGFLGFDGVGRWDVLTPFPFFLDTNLWKAKEKYSNSDGSFDKSPVRILHAPNHRGYKGTEFIISAVDRIKRAGLNVELILLEKEKNSYVRKVMCEVADILVDQIIFTGYAMNAIEGMSSGLVTVCNLEDERYTLPLRRWSFLNDCNIVSASPETIERVLMELVKNPRMRSELGKKNRRYAESYHSYDAAEFLFKNLINFLHGMPVDLINLYNKNSLVK